MTEGLGGCVRVELGFEFYVCGRGDAAWLGLFLEGAMWVMGDNKECGPTMDHCSHGDFRT
jgi:hypothetical protein